MSDNKDLANFSHTNNTNQMMIGFSLASGKKAPPISEKSIRKAQEMLINYEDNSLDLNFNQSFNETIPPAGFSLASGKQAPKISEESLRKAQNILNNSEYFEDNNNSFNNSLDSNFDQNDNEVIASTEFSLASGKQAPKISEESLRKAQNKFSSAGLNSNFNQNFDSSNSSGGFSLVSGKQAPKISEESLRKAQNMFSDSFNSDKSFNEPIPSAGFSLASGKQAPKISEESLRKAQNMFNNSDNNSNQNFNSSNSSGGFSLASGKQAPKISEESLRKAQNMFSDSFNSNQNFNEPIPSAGFSLASGKQAPKISEESLQKAKSMFNDSFNSNQSFNEPIPSAGFSLASGKQAPKISEESLQKAKSMFNDSFNSNQNFNSSNSSGGFSLASGKQAPKISEESLRKAQNMFSDSNQSFNEPIPSGGFSLASGKQAPKISEESLRKAQNMFNNSNQNFNEPVPSGGFSLASGKQAPKISEESLRKAQSMFNDSFNSNQSFNEPIPSGGFSLASGKQAPKISEESLRKAQNMFNNNSDSIQSNKRKFLSPANPFEAEDDFSQEIPSILSNPTPPSSQDPNLNLHSNSFPSSNSPIFPHPPSLDQSPSTTSSTYNSRLSSPFTSSMALKVQTTNSGPRNQVKSSHPFSPGSNSSLTITSSSPHKFSPTAMALQMKAGKSPMRMMANSAQQQQQQQQQAGRFTSMMSRNGLNPSNNNNNSLANRGSTSGLTFSEDEKNSSFYPQSTKYQQRTSSINPNEVVRQYPATPQVENRLINNNPIRQQQQKPKSKQFKPPKQISPPINNNNNGNQETDKASSSLIQMKEKKPFFDIEKVIRIDINRENDNETNLVNKPNKNQFIQRVSLKDYGRFYGIPKHSEEPFYPKDAEKYRFEDGSGSADFFVSLLDEGFHPLLLKTSWVKNHYKWIVWKLKNFDLSYPDRPRLLCYMNVLNELKYRAQVEILDAKRSCIRLLYERDHLNNAFMVLLVSDILPREAEGDMIELTDGWYSVPTRIDPYLAELVKNKQIKIGTKLKICNAQIDGETASEPLEDKRDTKLIIRINSVRRARWDQTLGYQKTALFPVSLSSLLPKGGPIPYVDVIIQRKYPFLYRETLKQDDSESSSQKDKNNSPIKSIIRNQEQQSRFVQKHEQKISEAIEGLIGQWQKELEEEGTDASNSSKLLKKYLKSADQSSFISSIVDPEERSDLITLIEKHKQQSEEFIRAKTQEYISDNTSEFTTFFSLLVTDLCPNNHSDAEVTFWRAPLDLYEADELKEGMTIRIYQLETSDTRADRLSSRGCPKFERIERKQSKTLFRKRFYLNSLSDIMIYANEMNLPLGTEFDFVCIALKLHNNKLYVCDGTPIIASIDLKPNSSDSSLSNLDNFVKYGVVCIENARFTAFDSNSGVAIFNAYDTTIISRSMNAKNKEKFVSFYKLKELMSFDSFLERVDQLTFGEQISYQPPNITNINQNSFMLTSEQKRFQTSSYSANNTLICSICDFEKIDFILFNVNNRIDNNNNVNLYDGKENDKSSSSSNDDKLVFFFGTPFSNSLWKSRYIENHQELERGLNFVLNVTDGKNGSRIVHINPLTISQFFNVIGRSVPKDKIKFVSSFYEKYFACENKNSQSWTEMKKLREAMKDRFKLDVNNIDTMLRATFFHMELIYDIEASVEMMKKKSTDLIFPFDEDEWLEFQDLLRKILVEIEFQFELYDNGNLYEEHVSIVSSISTVSINDQINHLMGLFDD